MTQAAVKPELHLSARRDRLPPDIAILIETYPREVWPAHANLGQSARFWLQRHDMFRDLGALLKAATQDLREKGEEPRRFQRFFAPRLGFFLNQLEGHHFVEDQHYFPLFRAADKRLLIGFDLLENDHEFIHGALEATAEAANRLLQALERSKDDGRKALDAYADQSDRLLSWLLRHLEDEEDLIIPVILHRTEGALGLS